MTRSVFIVVYGTADQIECSALAGSYHPDHHLTTTLTPLLDTSADRRAQPDRRAVPRGGRRPYDRPGRHPNLLVADGYEGARIPCARYLDHFGFHVDQASDGETAAAAIRERQPAVLLVDGSLPNVSSAGLLDWLNASGAHEVPVIVMLSDFDEDASKRLPTAASVLVKPFPLSTMLQEVRRALRGEAASSTVAG